MSKRSFYFALLLLLNLILIVACQAKHFSGEDVTQISAAVASTQQEKERINLVSLADLDQTMQIDVLRRENGDESTPAHFEKLFTLSNRETIDKLVQALDEDLDLSPRARCPALLTLVFHLADGHQQEFGYACEMASPTFLRGGQGFWQGKDVISPDAFNRLLSEKLSAISSLETPFLQ